MRTKELAVLRGFRMINVHPAWARSVLLVPISMYAKKEAADNLAFGGHKAAPSAAHTA